MKNTTKSHSEVFSGEKKQRYKLYKAKKNWMIAGIVTVTLLGGGSVTARASEDTAPPAAQTQTAATPAPSAEATQPAASTEQAAPATATTEQAAPAAAQASSAETAPAAAPSQSTPQAAPAQAETSQPAAPAASTASDTTSQAAAPAQETQAAPATSQSTQQADTAATYTAPQSQASASTGATASTSTGKATASAPETSTPKAATKTAKADTDAKKATSTKSEKKSDKTAETVKTDTSVKAPSASNKDTTPENFTKTYILYSEIDESKNDRGVIYASETKDGKTTYYTYNQDENKLVEITEANNPGLLEEISEANDAEKVTKYYLENTPENKAAFEDALATTQKNVGDYIIKESNELPAGFDKEKNLYNTIYKEVLIHPEAESQSDYAPIIYFTKKDDQYFAYNPVTDKFDLELDDDITKQLNDSNTQINYAKGEQLTNLLAAYQADPTQENYLNYIIHASKTDPGVDIPHETKEDPVSEYAGPEKAGEPGSGYELKQIYMTKGEAGEPDTYYLFDKDKKEFVPLKADDKELADYFAAFGSGVVKGTTLSSDHETALEDAVKGNLDYVKINGDVYKIQSVHDEKELPQGDEFAKTKTYTFVKENETDLQTDQPFNKLETTNPGVKISLIDYWLTTPDGDERTNANIGINAGNLLHFSTGSSEDSWNKYQNKNITTGIVQNELGEDGYPVLLVGTTTGPDGEILGGQSLAYLFDGNDGPFKKVYSNNQEEKIFIVDTDGNYVFNSDKFHADFDLGDPETTDDDKFVVYNKANMPVKPTQNTTGYEGEFFPLNNVNQFFNNVDNESGIPVTPIQDYLVGARTGSLQDPANPDDPTKNNLMNHYFGMTMETKYVQPKDGLVVDPETGDSRHMTFDFSGDDDFWLFIDGKLVLDIGGIHDALGGTIDFATGDITYHVPGATADPTVEIQKPEDIKSNLATILGSGWDDENIEHTMNVYYLERGNSRSHIKVGFNLQIPTFYYANKQEFSQKDSIDRTYVYGENSATKVDNQISGYQYAENERYGVRLTEKTPEPGPGPNPGPDPTPTPTPTPTPEPEPTPTPTPEEPHTPDVDPDTEAKPVTPAVPEDSAHTPATPSGPAGSATQVATPAPASEAKAPQVTVAAPAKTETPATPVTPEAPQKVASSVLPQTGETTDHAGLLGLIMVGLTGLLGLFGLKKKKEQ